jgi:hypothetical protein
MKFLLVGLAFVSAVTALPNGAPACNVGAANVQSQHLKKERNPQTGPNESVGYQSILAGKVLIQQPSDPTFFNLFQFGKENELIIQAGAGTYLKGILVIASGGDTEIVDILDTRTPQALTSIDPTRTKESIGCDGIQVSSIVQTEPSEKLNINMNFKWPTEGQKLYLDVNIVKNNNDTAGSQYYFTQYPMQAVVIPETPDPCTPAGACGLLRLSIFCPLTRCGLFGRLLGLCDKPAC